MQKFMLLIAQALIDRAEEKKPALLELAKIKGALVYIKGIQTVRQILISVIGINLLLNLAAAGFILAHAGLFIILPWTETAKLTLVLILAGLYLLLGAGGLIFVFSQKRWMSILKADALVEKLRIK